MQTRLTLFFWLMGLSLSPLMGSPMSFGTNSALVIDFDATLKGRIVDSTGEGVPFVSIGIVLPSSGELLGGGTSDELGAFQLNISSPEALTLRISAVGYEELIYPLAPLSSGESREIGTLVVRESVGDLEEVTVRAARPDVRIEADKTVMRVAGTVLAEGNHALDVLGRAPGVFIDQEGRIQLNGRSGVVVFINDRQTYMSAEDLATFLRSMPADNIEHIEVIANPGARYDAEGAGGVINIQLKKNTLDGVFGNVQLGSLYNGRYSPTLGVALNAKKGAWTTQFNVNYNEFAFDNELEIFRNFAQENGVATFDQQSLIAQRNRNLFTNATVDYAINDQHTVGMNVQLSGTASTENTPSFTQIDAPGALQPDFFESFNRGDVQIGRVFANFNYVGKLDTLGTRLSADIDITRMDRSRDALLTNFFWTGSQREEATRSRILNEEAMDYRIFTAKVDFYRLWPKAPSKQG
ncbi:TonB-dependent receptor [Nitritalea halalkaliphila]|uniref:TonB-dependent receptor n=1 Tax=Nitritalea halalkaliphila TaxID=590849 RepID=UPI0002F5BA23|nr:TonB-dependent receptor plug domain-containing protein [Nitritalea halalkaliphila]